MDSDRKRAIVTGGNGDRERSRSQVLSKAVDPLFIADIRGSSGFTAEFGPVVDFVLTWI